MQLPPRCKSVTPQASVTSRRYSAVPMPPKAPQSTVSSTNVRRATMAPRQGSSSSVSLASATSRRTSMTSGKSTPTVARKVTPSRQDSLPEFDLGLDNISLSGANADSASAPSLFDISALITHVQADIMDKSMDADEAVPPSASSSSTSSSSVRSRLYAKRAQQEHEAKARVTEMAAYAGMRATPSRMSSSSLRESLSVESLVGVIRAEPAPVAAAPHQLTNPDIAQDRTVEMEEEIAREVDKLSASFDALVAASPTKRIPRGFGM